MNEFDKINQKNLPNWESALEYLTKVLAENNITYYLSASGLRYIQGEKYVYPYDIDLFMSEDSVKQAFELLKEFKTSDLRRWEESLLEFQGRYNNTPFEICEWEERPKQLVDFKFKGIDVSIVK